MFIVFSDNFENVIQVLQKRVMFWFWRSVDTADDNVFPLGSNDFDKDGLSNFWVSKFAFLKKSIFNIVLWINPNSPAYFWFSMVGDKIVSGDIYKLWSEVG